MENNNAEKYDFSKGNILTTMLKLAIPITLAQLVNVLYNIIDRIFIGNLPVDSNNALTGLGVAFPICTIVMAFSNLISTGATPLFSIARGNKDTTEAAKIMGNSFIMLIITGIILSIAGYIFKPWLLYLFGASPETFGYADSYLNIYLTGTIFVLISLGLNSFINASGFAKTGMLTVIIGAACNIILDYIFIYQLGLGVPGAATATVISQFISATWTLLFLTSKKALIRLSSSNFKLKASRVRNILTLGLSGFTMGITNSAVQIAGNSCLSLYGGDLYIGAMTIINSIREVIQMPVMGLSNSAQPVLGFNFGAKKYDRLISSIRILTCGLLLYTTVAWIIAMCFSRPIVQSFTSDPELINITIECLHIYFFGFFLMTFQFTGQTVFTALGKSAQAIFFSLLRKAIIVIPLIYLLPMIPFIGVHGVFLSEPISNCIGGLACFITMYFTVYKPYKKKIQAKVSIN